MTTDVGGESVCTTCGQTKGWHDKNETRHSFNDGSIPVSSTFGKKLPDGSRATPDQQVEVTEVTWPFDPVLRMALVDKGIVTPDDLKAAEAKIRMVSGQ